MVNIHLLDKDLPQEPHHTIVSYIMPRREERSIHVITMI